MYKNNKNNKNIYKNFKKHSPYSPKQYQSLDTSPFTVGIKG
jgi:hypothetical protein